MPHAGARRGGWHPKGAGRDQPVPLRTPRQAKRVSGEMNRVLAEVRREIKELQREEQDDTEFLAMPLVLQPPPSAPYAYVNDIPAYQGPCRLTKMPEEVLLWLCTNFLSPSARDLLSLSRAGSGKLHRIAARVLLETDEPTLVSSLHWACKRGHIPTLETALEIGASPDYAFPYILFGSSFACHMDASTPLGVAVRHGQSEVAALLLRKYGADPNACRSRSPNTVFFPGTRPGFWWRTPLQWALAAWLSVDTRIFLVELLLNHGACVRPGKSFGLDEPVALALLNDNLPAPLFTRMLQQLPHDGRVGIMDDIMREVLVHALNTSSGSFTAQCVKRFQMLKASVVEAAPDAERVRRAMINSIGNVLHTPFSLPSQHRCLELLLTGHRDTSEAPLQLFGSPLLLTALRCHNLRWNEGLMQKDGLTRKDAEMVITNFKLLQDSGFLKTADFQVTISPPYIGRPTPLSTDLTFHHFPETPVASLCVPVFPLSFSTKIIDFLVENEALIDAKSSEGLTALHYAAKFALAGTVKHLLDHGANVHIADSGGRTALHRACCLAFPINPSDLERFEDGSQQQSRRHRRAQRAVKNRSYIVRLLLESRADPLALDAQGFTPLHYACRDGFPDLVALLLDRCPQAARQAHHDSGKTPLHTLFLPYAGTDLTPGHFLRPASAKLEIARMLIAAGADVRARDVLGNLPIKFARDARHVCKDCCDLLVCHGGEDDGEVSVR